MDISSFLIDIDGTLYDGEQAIPGGMEALEFLRRKGLPFLLVTNTTRMPKRDILARLGRLGFRVAAEEVFPVPAAAIDYIKSRRPHARCFMIAARTIDEEFQAAGLQPVREEQAVDLVVISQYQWIHFGELDIACRLIQAGAEPVAMHRDMTYPEHGKINISLGPVIAALEAATRVPVTIIGKPNARFFELALRHAGFERTGSVMVGDNYDGDVRGAIEAGLRAIQVRTGSFDPQTLAQANVAPTWILPSIADLPRWFDALC